MNRKSKFTVIAKEYIDKYPEIATKNYSKLANIAIKEDARLTPKNWRVLRYIISELVKGSIPEADIVEENVKFAKNVQKQQDLNRIKNKAFREFARVENALVALNKELIIALEDKGTAIKTIQHKVKEDSPILLVQLSDTHFNELVDLRTNKYNFIVAAQRLQKYAEEIKKEARMRGVTKIILAMTGDMMNSDRRLDEILAMATNRAKASIISTNLISYFIKDLNTVANVDVTYITGNETRIKDEYGFTENVTSDNYDTLIYEMLKMLFKGNKGINFLDGDSKEKVIQVKGKNILLTHGEEIKNSQKGVQQKIGKYSGSGIDIHYVIFGHIHFANLTDLYTRSGSLVGMNSYSDKALDLVTRASQVMHIITENSTHGMRVDLQDIEGFEGYPIQDDLDAYNAKSESKIHKHETIISIVV